MVDALFGSCDICSLVISSFYFSLLALAIGETHRSLMDNGMFQALHLVIRHVLENKNGDLNCHVMKVTLTASSHPSQPFAKLSS
jgi:hypothetical protein